VRLASALAASLLFAGVTQAAPLRIAAISATPGACHALAATAPAGEAAYYRHLAKRLEVEVQQCPFADARAAGAAVAAGQADMALLDPAAFKPVRATTRAILTVRARTDSNRIPVILAVRAGDPRRTLASLKGASVAFGGRTPAGLTTPRAVLAERGAGPGFFREVVEGDGEVALQQLRDRKVDAVAVHVAAWQRVCRMVSPKAPEPCGDLAIVFKARPRATRALVVRRDMPQELRYRLIGIHMPLHLEAPAAFAFATAWAPGAAEFQPAEADALTLANLK
jgi:ABC-type phosphate/phosphonate transport system substrate-binding protein